MAQYEEQERRIAYLAWERACREAGGHVFINNPVRPCYNKRGCIPDRIDWSHTSRANRARCVR